MLNDCIIFDEVRKQQNTRQKELKDYKHVPSFIFHRLKEIHLSFKEIGMEILHYVLLIFHSQE